MLTLRGRGRGRGRGTRGRPQKNPYDPTNDPQNFVDFSPQSKEPVNYTSENLFQCIKKNNDAHISSEPTNQWGTSTCVRARGRPRKNTYDPSNDPQNFADFFPESEEPVNYTSTDLFQCIKKNNDNYSYLGNGPSNHSGTSTCVRGRGRPRKVPIDSFSQTSFSGNKNLASRTEKVRAMACSGLDDRESEKRKIEGERESTRVQDTPGLEEFPVCWMENIDLGPIPLEVFQKTLDLEILVNFFDGIP